jgi:hypothetical protein
MTTNQGLRTELINMIFNQMIGNISEAGVFPVYNYGVYEPSLQGMVG